MRQTITRWTCDHCVTNGLRRAQVEEVTTGEIPDGWTVATIDGQERHLCSYCTDVYAEKRLCEELGLPVPVRREGVGSGGPTRLDLLRLVLELKKKGEAV